MNMSKSILATAAISIVMSAPSFADTPPEMAYVFVKGHPQSEAAPAVNTEPEMLDLDDKQFAIELARTDGNTVPMIASPSAASTTRAVERQPQMKTAAQSRQFRIFLNELAKSKG
jgi:hypothetical protein